MSSIAIRAEGLEKSFAAVRALKGVGFEIAEGEVVALFGPNGAGKTTLVKILAGLSRPSAGTATVLGKSAREPSVRASIGVLGHAGWLHDALTAEENLAFYGNLYGVQGLAARIDVVLGEVGLSDRRRDRVRTFSRGMRQRLSIARAVLHDPKVLLLDEPFTGLDRAAARALASFLRRVVAGTGRTVLAVTHELDVGFDLATRVMILAGGRLVLDRGAAGLDRATFEQTYLAAVDGASAPLAPGDATLVGAK